MPQASTLIRTHPAFGAGIARWTSWNGPPAVETWTTRIVLDICADYTNSHRFPVEILLWQPCRLRFAGLHFQNATASFHVLTTSAIHDRDNEDEYKMKMVTLPDGTGVPALGQGTWRIGEKKSAHADEVAALRLGIELGMN